MKNLIVNKNTMYPTTVVDGFLQHPDVFRKLAQSLEYAPCPSGRWPGLRTKPLEETEYASLANNVKGQVAKIFHSDMENCAVEGGTYFQRIPTGDSFLQGSIHHDPTVVTAMVYLNKDYNLGCGTSIYSKNMPLEKFGEFSDAYNGTHDQKKREYYLSKDRKELREEYEQSLKDFNSHFTETIRVSNVYNRAIIFEGNQWHGAQSLETQTDEDRLFLILFIYAISSNSSPIARSNLMGRI